MIIFDSALRGIDTYHLIVNTNWNSMDKLEAVQRILRFSNSIREWCEKEHSIYFDDFDNENVENYEAGGYGKLADAIIEDGFAENIIDEEDVNSF